MTQLLDANDRFIFAAPAAVAGQDPTFQVIDRQTGVVVMELESAAESQAYRQVMNAFPEIGGQISYRVQAYYISCPGTRETAAFNRDWDRLIAELGTASAAWRAAGHLAHDPWANPAS